MNVKVTITKTKEVEITTIVKNVSSLEAAEKCAMRYVTGQYQPNVSFVSEERFDPDYEIGMCEITTF